MSVYLPTDLFLLLLAHSTPERLRIAGITAPVDVESLFPPTGAPSRPIPSLGSSVSFTPGARAQLPAMLGGSSEPESLLARSTSEGLRIAGITAPVDVDDLSSSLFAEAALLDQALRSLLTDIAPPRRLR